MRTPCSPMQLTRGADYAVRALIHMAATPSGTRFMLPELAHLTGAPEDFLSKVLQALRHAGFIQSWRGRAGGFEILSAGRESTIRAVVEAIDGPLYLNVCVSRDGACGRKGVCPAHPVWARAQTAVLQVLSSKTIASLASETKPRNACSQLPQTTKLPA